MTSLAALLLSHVLPKNEPTCRLENEPHNMLCSITLIMAVTLISEISSLVQTNNFSCSADD